MDGRKDGWKERRKDERNDGRKEGRMEGRNDGTKGRRKEGWKERRMEGRKDGRKEGNNEGWKERMKDGRKEGGKKEGGKKEGRKDRRKEMFYITMHTMWLLYGSRWSAVDLRSNLDIVPLFCFGGKKSFSSWTCRKEGNVLFNDALNLFTVIWRRTYGKRPFRERKPAAATTWATLSY